MAIIASVVFLIAGTILAAIATARWSMLEPYGLIPYFIGHDIDFEQKGQFLVYFLRGGLFRFDCRSGVCAAFLWAVGTVASGGGWVSFGDDGASTQSSGACDVAAPRDID